MCWFVSASEPKASFAAFGDHVHGLGMSLKHAGLVALLYAPDDDADLPDGAYEPLAVEREHEVPDGSSAGLPLANDASWRIIAVSSDPLSTHLL